MTFGAAILAAMGNEEAHRRMGEILSRKEFGGWINLVDTLATLFKNFTRAFAALPAAVQIAILAVLGLALLAILTHWIITLMKMLGRRAAPPDRGSAETDLDRLLRTSLGSDELQAQALARLGDKDYREAVRLLFVAFIKRLRDAGAIPVLRSLTARDVARLLRPMLPRIDEASRLFEKSTYSRHPLVETEATWMLEFVESSRPARSGGSAWR